MRTSWHDDRRKHQREAFDNQKGREAAKEGSGGGGADGRMMMVIRKGRREVVGVGRRNDRASHAQQLQDQVQRCRCTR
jgi:hypothetical protein